MENNRHNLLENATKRMAEWIEKNKKLQVRQKKVIEF